MQVRLYSLIKHNSFNYIFEYKGYDIFVVAECKNDLFSLGKLFDVYFDFHRTLDYEDIQKGNYRDISMSSRQRKFHVIKQET